MCLSILLVFKFNFYASAAFVYASAASAAFAYATDEQGFHQEGLPDQCSSWHSYQHVILRHEHSFFYFWEHGCAGEQAEELKEPVEDEEESAFLLFLNI
jgi:hypothetical protein